MDNLYQAFCSFATKVLEVLDRETKEVFPSLVAIKVSNEVPQSLARANPLRVELWIHNYGDKDLLIAPVKDIGVEKFSMRIAPNDTVILNAHNNSQVYKREWYGFWENGVASSAKVMITEYSAK